MHWLIGELQPRWDYHSGFYNLGGVSNREPLAPFLSLEFAFGGRHHYKVGAIRNQLPYVIEKHAQRQAQ